MNRNYKPSPIPRREILNKESKEEVIRTLRKTIDRIVGASANKSISFEDDPFTQVEITTLPDTPNKGGAIVPNAQSVQPSSPRDKIRVRFTEMRRLGNTNIHSKSYDSYTAKTFYAQATFMADFEDDCPGTVTFSSYFPNYQLMGYDQLRAYFTWRTQVRNGCISETSVSFAFLYIYELLNNIGVESPQDGLDKLTEFWQAFRVFEPSIDSYVLQWLKDYHVYYLPETSFQDFARANGLVLHYPAVFGYDSGEEDSFELFASISKYNIRKSAFYSEETLPVISACFYSVLTRLREVFAARGKCFEDFIFYIIEREASWSPFQRALFHAVIAQPDHQVTISEREFYSCERNLWTYRTALLTDRGGALIGYIMKAMEAALRRVLKFKYKLSANESSLDPEMLRSFTDLGISLSELIAQGTAEFYARYTRTEVKVNPESLARIRKEALDTQDKLIVPEDDAEALHKTELNPAPAPPPTIIAAPISDIWAQFRAILTPTELAAIAVILRGENFKAFTTEQGIMPEVLIDSINQKASDIIGDTIMEFDGTATIYEDYMGKITETVKS